MFGSTTLIQKIVLSNTILFVDFDGTVFTADKKIITAPFYNRQIKYLLQANTIPLVIVTGRTDWGIKGEVQSMLLGLPKPDAVIAGAGTVIYYRLPNEQLGKDTSWEKRMEQSPLQWKNVAKILWNQEILLQKIHGMLLPNMHILPKAGNPYLVRLQVQEIPLQQVLQWKKIIEVSFLDTLQVLFAEKLLQKNTSTIFSGHILLVPKVAGKAKAVEYILNVIATEKKTHVNKHLIRTFCFGDATVDVPMLLLSSQLKKYTMQTYGVNLTPLAKKLLQENSKEKQQVHILENPASPKAILEILNKSMRNDESQEKRKSQQPTYSPAQNNFCRYIIQPLEPLLDTLFEKNLTPNDISLEGLAMVKKSITILYDQKNLTFLKKVKAWQLYISGNIADIADGIRARRTMSKETHIPGQLIDTFCDRAKEMYQLHARAEKRVPAQHYQTLLASISCLLPSIARAQAEANGIIVKEQDIQGGSMLNRTRKLFLSLFCDTLGFKKQSYEIDKKIYATNSATFQNRLKNIPVTEKIIGTFQKSQTKFQYQAFERFLLLIQLLQEEHEIIKKTIQKHPEFLRSYEKEDTKIIEDYLRIDVVALRKKEKVNNYNLSYKKWFVESQ